MDVAGDDVTTSEPTRRSTKESGGGGGGWCCIRAAAMASARAFMDSLFASTNVFLGNVGEKVSSRRNISSRSAVSTLISSFRWPTAAMRRSTMASLASLDTTTLGIGTSLPVMLVAVVVGDDDVVCILLNRS
jgi:hypothetical protein